MGPPTGWANVIIQGQVRSRYRDNISGEPGTEDAVQVARQQLEVHLQGHQEDEAEYKGHLVFHLSHRYKCIGATADFEEASQLTEDILAPAFRNHPSRAWFLSIRAALLAYRYQRRRVMADLDEAIRVMRESTDIVTQHSGLRAWGFNNLGLYTKLRYDGVGDSVDLEEAILATRKALELCPGNHQDRLVYVHCLIGLLLDRFLKIGAAMDLEEAVSLASEAMDITPEENPCRDTWLPMIARVCFEMYRVTRTSEDLDVAISSLQEAVETVSSSDPDENLVYHLLGLAYLDRYKTTNAVADLEAALRLSSASAISPMSKRIPCRLEVLGAVFHEKYFRDTLVSNLDSAIKHYQEALNMTTLDDPERFTRYNQLSSGYRDRYNRTNTASDLEIAFRLAQEAVNLTPHDHQARAAPLENLGGLYKQAYNRTGNPSDLEVAIRLYREAVDTTPEGHESRASRLYTLVIEYEHMYRRSGAISNLKTTVELLQDALNDTHSRIRARITAGKRLVSLHTEANTWEQAYEAARTIINLVPPLTKRNLQNVDKKYLLSQLTGFATDAAAIAINAGQQPLCEIQLLEWGRGVLLGSFHEHHVDVSDLLRCHPKLGKEYLDVQADRDPTPDRNSKLPPVFRKFGNAFRMNQSYEVADRREKIIEEIRGKPGFQDFLLAPSEQKIKDAAQQGPIVIINISEYRCDAVLVETHRLDLVPLPHLSKSDVVERLETGELGSVNTLEWLWNVVASPILGALGFTTLPSDGNWPHIWWIPTGPLSKFPLHAAGLANKHSGENSQSVLDRVISSYSVSIKSILTSRANPLSNPELPPQVVLVAMEHTPGNTSLPFVKEEAAVLHDICRSMSLTVNELPPYQEGILSALSDSCSIFHFAGHGYTNSKDAMMSYLCVGAWEREQLKVVDLLMLNLHKRPPFLAYLSACNTGRTEDEDSLDESIHLISACQMVGFRHVIGTLWQVNDEQCVEMARIIYESMRDGGSDGRGGLPWSP